MMSSSKQRIQCHQQQLILREEIKANGYINIPLTAAHNRVHHYEDLNTEKADYEQILKEQLKSWLNLIPFIIRHFKKITTQNAPKK